MINSAARQSLDSSALELLPQHIMVIVSLSHDEDVWRSGDIAPRILNLGARWRWVIKVPIG